jgi:hypothetical protein
MVNQVSMEANFDLLRHRQHSEGRGVVLLLGRPEGTLTEEGVVMSTVLCQFGMLQDLPRMALTASPMAMEVHVEEWDTSVELATMSLTVGMLRLEFSTTTRTFDQKPKTTCLLQLSLTNLPRLEDVVEVEVRLEAEEVARHEGRRHRKLTPSRIGCDSLSYQLGAKRELKECGIGYVAQG